MSVDKGERGSRTKPGTVQPQETGEKRRHQLLRRSSQGGRKTRRMCRAGHQVRKCFKSAPEPEFTGYHPPLSLERHRVCFVHHVGFIYRRSSGPWARETAYKAQGLEVSARW